MRRASSRGRGKPLAVAVALAALVLGGCITERRREPGRPATGVTSRQVRGPSSPPQPNDLTDPCAARMHDLSGLLLMYYAVNKRLPDRVEELAAFADVDVEFAAACPVSGRPYIYAPGGLQSSSGGERYLILYDAVPAHGGLRWGVFVAPPGGGQLPATWVILMSEEVFRGYVPQTR